MSTQAAPSGAIYDLSAGTYANGELRVLSFEGHEEINSLYALDVRFWAADVDEADLQAAILGRPASLVMHLSGGVVQHRHGIVREVSFEGKHPGGRHSFRIGVVPRLWLLGRRVNSRIFQDKTVREVVDAVLEEHGVARVWHLSKKYTTRQYCVQHQESDLAFVTRVLAEEGIFFSFAHPDDVGAASVTERLVLGDTPEAYARIVGSPALVYRQQTGDGALKAEEDQVLDFRLRTQVEPARVVLHDYDFKRPRLDLTGVAPDASATLADAPAFTHALEVYDHHGEYEEPDADAARAGTYLEQLRARVREAEGASVCRRLSPGLTFDLGDHPIEKLNGGWVVTRVEHRGFSPEGDATHGGQIYENRFRCAPAAVALRPARPTKPLRQVMETALVVGPAGQEIHTDAFGRVKVQFHWDREGQKNEHSSCWMRVMQAWAGTGWGAQFIPRIGMEVVVGFLGGDVDRPVVMGSLYNAENPVPYRLPEQKATSGIKSRSTPGSTGYNEILFDDAAGQEMLSLHAERDLHEAVGHDRESLVRHDAATTVLGSMTEVVRGHRTRTVTGGETVTITGVSSFAVEGSRTESMRGSVHSSTSRDRSFETGGDENHTISGDRTATIKGSDHIVAHGARSVVVGTPSERKGDALTHVWGRVTSRATDMNEIVGDGSIVLRSGKSTIEILPDKVRITAPTIEVVATDALSARGGGDGGPVLKLQKRAEVMAEEIHLRTEGARLGLKKNATIKGDKILLNSDEPPPEDDKDETKTPKTVTVKLRLFDADQKPYADKPYALVVGSSSFEGKTDGSGRLSAVVPATAKTGRVQLWPAAYPAGPTVEWTVALDTLGPADSPRELQKRLANLGYPSGPPTEQMNDRLRDALRAYQAANQLAITGEVDDDTKALLHIIHP